MLGEEHPATLESIDTLGVLLNDQGERELAMLHYREALEKRRRILGQDHPDTLRSLNNIAGLLNNQGERDKALEYHREALEKRGARFGRGSSRHSELNPQRGRRVADAEQAERGDGIIAGGDQKKGQRRVLGQDHPDTLNSINILGEMLRDQGRLDEAVDRFREVMEKLRRLLGDAHPKTLNAAKSLGATLADVIRMSRPRR